MMSDFHQPISVDVASSSGDVSTMHRPSMMADRRVSFSLSLYFYTIESSFSAHDTDGQLSNTLPPTSGEY